MREKKQNSLTHSLNRQSSLYFLPHARAREEEKEEMSSGVTTRAQKRRMGQRDLWDVIVHNDDVCFKHILPKLNGTDVKFLFEVNRETRALVKRSSRKDDLGKAFKVSKMSSISTLEFAWNNVHWGTKSMKGAVMNRAWFCAEVAQTNKLELLKWAREGKKCQWDKWTINEASAQGNLDMIKYCVANHCPMDEFACACAAISGHLECIKYLHEEVKAPWDWQTELHAAAYGQLHMLEYLVECKFEFTGDGCVNAAEYGQLDCLKYLHETAKSPLHPGLLQSAYYNDHFECVQYLLDNDCPLPRGWRYENGELYEHSSESESESES